jgi:PAS domain S-box-containing protein
LAINPSERVASEILDTYAAVLDALPIAAYVHDRDGALIYVSPEWERFTGNRAAELLEGDPSSVVHPDDRAGVFAAWEAARGGGQTFRSELRLRFGDGTYRWIACRTAPILDAGGVPIAWCGLVADINERKLAEEAALAAMRSADARAQRALEAQRELARADEAREKFVSLAENSGDFIAMTDLAGRVTYANPAALRLLAPDDPAALRFLDCFVPEDREFVESVIFPAIEREGRWVGQFRMRNLRTGAPFPILFNAFTLTGANGERLGVATISRDLRDRWRIDIGMRALAEAGAEMYTSLDYEETLQNIAEAVTRTFATFCTIDVIDDEGAFRRVAIAHPRAEMRDFIASVADPSRFTAQHPITRAIRHGESTCLSSVEARFTSLLTADTREAYEKLGIRCNITVPMRLPDGTVFGAIVCCLDAEDPHPPYGPEDVPFAEELGRRAGIAVQHARAYAREHAIAMRFQEASLPGSLPAGVEGVRLSADYRPGHTESTIGGDWYDAFTTADGRLVITIGDVLGKGLDAAVTMAKLRQAMRSAAALVPEPLAMLTAAESAISEQTHETYATALAAVYDPASRALTFASAGHPGPAILRANGEVEDHFARGTLLGVRGQASRVMTVACELGSALVFFTDGLTEATRDLDEGYRRLHVALADPDVANAPNRARAVVDHVLRGRAATDDVAVLVAEIGPRRLAGGRRSWRVPARVDEVARIRRAVREAAAPVAHDDRFLLELAAGELVSNAVKYGTGPFVDVALRLAGGACVLEVENEGEPFERRAVDLAATRLDESGRGLAMLLALGFDVAVECRSGRCTVAASLRP